jgi:hypothetical protein
MRIILSRWSIPGWIGAAWLMVANIITAQSLFSAAVCIGGWLDKHPRYIGIFCIVWFTGLATHEKWKQHVPTCLRLRPTPHQRLTAIETGHIPDMVRNLEGMVEAAKINAKSIATNEGSISRLALRVDDLDALLGRTVKRINKTVPAVMCLSQMVLLTREADYCIDRYIFLRDTFPNGLAALLPLDWSWRKVADGQDYGTHLAVEWAEALEIHIHRVNGFFATPGKRAFDDDTVVLYTYAAMKKSFADITAKKFEEILAKHRSRLGELRDAYAATCLEAS